MERPDPQLSESQRACLRLVATGLNSKEIAIELRLTPNTVDTYMRAANKALGVSTRQQAARAFAALEQSQQLRPQSPPVADAAESATSEASRRDGVPAASVVQEPVVPFDYSYGASPKELRQRVRDWLGRVGNDLTMTQRLRWMALCTVVVLAAIFLGLAAVESFQRTLLRFHGFN